MKARARYYIPIFVSILFMAIFFFMDTAKAEECKIFKENDYYYYDFGDGRIYDINHNVIYQLDSSKKIYTVVDYPLNWCTEAYSALAQYDPSIQIRPDGNVVIVDTIKGKKVTAIAEGVFELAQNPVLTSMKIGKNVTTIGKRAFAHCTYMTDVILPASLKKIGEEAFYQTGIVSISIGKNVTSIGRYAFSSCESLEDVNLSDGKLKSLPFGCFAFCESLKSITLPANITKISNHAFYSCDSLQIAKIKGKITSIPEECFYGCKSLKTFTIPSSVTIIKHSAFQGSGLEKITIPKRVKTLETAAFSQTNLKTVSVPSSVKTDNGAFMNCEKLYQIEYTSGTTNMSWARFDGGTGFNLNRVTIVAPKKSVAYKYCYRAGFMTTENKEQKVAKNCNWMVVNENWQFRMMNCGENLKWKSSNNSILKITSNGKAVAKKVGTVTVTGYSDTQKYTFKIKVMKRTLNNVMKVITNETVRPEMSDYEKFCGACIWLGQNVDYDTETYEAHLGDETAVENLKSYTMEGALIDGLAVCQGFSEAFKYIMDYYDIPCRIVTSGPMDHAWNAIQINKKWYFLDTLGGANLFDKSAKGYYGYSFPYKLSDPEKVNWTSRTVSANSRKRAVTFKMDPYLNTTKVTLVKGGVTFTLKLEGAKVKSFTSKNKKIATVSKKGVVTAKGKGNTTIVVKTTTGKTFSCKVTVDVPKLNKTKITLNKGKTYQLKLSGTKQEITWKSSNTKVATVALDGKVAAIGKGTAKITATVGGKQYICNVTVKIPHVHKYTEKVTTLPTCTTSGEKKYTCSCGDTYTKPIEKIGHNYQWNITKKPSETTAKSASDFGERDLICQNCKDNKATETIVNIGTQLIYGYFDEVVAAEFLKEINSLRSEQGCSDVVRELLEESSEMTQIAQLQAVEKAAPYADDSDIHICYVDITRNLEYISMFVPQSNSAKSAISFICEESDAQEILLTQEALSVGTACFYMQSSDYGTDGKGGTYQPYWTLVFEIQ